MAESLIAHTSEDGRQQSLSEHLKNVGRMAGTFAAAFGAGKWGTAAGLLHDDGKAQGSFQRRIRGENLQVDHSTPGAKYAHEHFRSPKGAGKLIAYCIAGHHAGLPDGNAGDDESCLTRRLSRAHSSPGYLAAEVPGAIEAPPVQRPPADPAKRAFSIAFFTRMLYSCLVDSDFLDTERFCEPAKAAKRGEPAGIRAMKAELDRHLARVCEGAQATELNRLRAQVLEDCRRGATAPVGLFSLTVPTGGGKTLSSLAFALDHALLHGLRRVIYVIPYTSIIEQTARVFRDVFGDDAVLEHHSNLVREVASIDEEDEERHRLAAENWDAPIVVTTNVQFFESFFASRSSRARKLHNVAKSVVILDEAQMLPVPLLRPSLEVIRELARAYGTTVVLCTATQPALTREDEFRDGLADVRELMRPGLDQERAFSRVRARRLPETSDAEIAGLIRKHDRCLCIVNTRRHARVLFEAVAEVGPCFHLSAAMCPAHRSSVLGNPREPEAGSIRQRLRDREPCRVVSTQLVEAGVDVDFPVVLRAMAGLDSIVQAAGRCNREGRIAEGGELIVFSPEQGLPVGHFRQCAQITQLVLHETDRHMLDPETVRAYFRELYWMKDQGDGLDAYRIMPLLAAGVVNGDFPFRTVASLYRLIPDAQTPVIIPFDETASGLCDDLRHAEGAGPVLRLLQPYTVQVYPHVLAQLVLAGYVEALQQERYYVLSDLGLKEAYHPELGLCPELPEYHDVENLVF